MNRWNRVVRCGWLLCSSTCLLSWNACSADWSYELRWYSVALAGAASGDNWELPVQVSKHFRYDGMQYVREVKDMSAAISDSWQLQVSSHYEAGLSGLTPTSWGECNPDGPLATATHNSYVTIAVPAGLPPGNNGRVLVGVAFAPSMRVEASNIQGPIPPLPGGGPSYGPLGSACAGAAVSCTVSFWNGYETESHGKTVRAALLTFGWVRDTDDLYSGRPRYGDNVPAFTVPMIPGRTATVSLSATAHCDAEGKGLASASAFVNGVRVTECRDAASGTPIGAFTATDDRGLDLTQPLTEVRVQGVEIATTAVATNATNLTFTLEVANTCTQTVTGLALYRWYAATAPQWSRVPNGWTGAWQNEGTDLPGYWNGACMAADIGGGIEPNGSAQFQIAVPVPASAYGIKMVERTGCGMFTSGASTPLVGYVGPAGLQPVRPVIGQVAAALNDQVTLRLLNLTPTAQNIIENSPDLATGRWERVHSFLTGSAETNWSATPAGPWRQVFYRIRSR